MADSEGIALTIGVFDGVHRGHQSLIHEMVAYADRRGLTTGCITFDPDPEVIVHAERKHAALSSIAERTQLLHSRGIVHVDVVPFTHHVALQGPEEFVGLLRERYEIAAIWVGKEFALGRDRSGTVDALHGIANKWGFELHTVEPLEQDGQRISATWIREALAAGDVRLASALLGRAYCIQGTVIPGMRRGRDIGFPTANVSPPDGRALPADGVYYVHAGDEAAAGDNSVALRGVVNLGPRPTFDEHERLLETHLLDFEGDLYGRTLQVCFLERLRGIQRFSDVSELRAQLERDVAVARDMASAAPEGRG